MAFRVVRIADVLPQCCPAARIRLLKSVIPCARKATSADLPQDYKGERHVLIAKRLTSQSGQEWVAFEVCNEAGHLRPSALGGMAMWAMACQTGR